MLTLQELTSTNIKSLSIDQLTILHRGVHRGAKGGGDYDILTSSHKLLAMELERQGVGHGTPLNISKPSIHAIYLKSPHGALIADGKKRAIAKSHPVNGMEGKRIIVSKENGVGLAFGMATIGAFEVINVEQFDKRFDEHRVTAKERNRWWEGVEKFALYPIFTFTPYDIPRQVEVPAGTQTLMQNVKFIPDLMQLPNMKTIVTKGENDMPWKVFKRGSEFCVFKITEDNKPTGKTLGCHPSPAKAQAQVRALFASESKKMIAEVEAVIDEVLDTPTLPIIPTEPDITPTLSAQLKAEHPNQTTCTCANCKEKSEHEPGTPCREIECPKCGSMLRGGGDSEKAQSEISAEVIQAIADIVHAKLQEEKTVIKAIVEPEPDPQLIVKPENVEIKAGRRVRKDKLAKLKDLFAQLKDLIGWAAYDDIVPNLVLPVAKSFKGADGRTWFMLWTTNSYKDRDEEIFRIKAIQDYVSRYANNPIKGEFQFWHIPGTKFGDIVWQAIVSDRFLVQMGPFDDTPIGNAFKDFFTTHPDNHPNIAPTGWGASHGYNYIGPDRLDGVYDWFNTVESSVLPTVYAANLHNPNPLVLGGKEMNDKQSAALRAIGEEVGINLVELVTKVGEQKRAEIDDFVEHKSKETDQIEPTESEPAVKSGELQASEEGTQEANVTVAAITAAVVEALQMESLSDTLKSIEDNGAKVTGELVALTERVAELEQTDEKKLAERTPSLPQMHWFQASQAKATILTAEEDKLVPDTSRQAPVLPIPVRQRQ